MTIKPTTKRIFLAIHLPDDLRESIKEVQQELSPRLPAINWVRPESIHLTVKFLGYVVPSLIDEMHSVVAPVVSQQFPFTVVIQGLGVFPDARYPRILWVGLRGNEEVLQGFVHRLDRVLESLGFAMENKPYHPHLTLARIKRENKAVGLAMAQEDILQEECQLGSLSIHQLTLYQSELSPSGAVYSPLWTIPLNGDSAAE